MHLANVKLENAFPSEIAAEARAILWSATGCDPEDKRTWTRPVIRLGDSTNWWARADGFRRTAWAHFQSGFRTRTIRETQAGMWTRAFPRSIG
jgi:hypothetical protein